MGRAPRVRERLSTVEGEVGLRVVLLAKRLPHLVALDGAELGVSRQLDERGLHLRTAARAEQRADHGADRDQVGGLERRNALAGKDVRVAGEVVLAGEVQPVLRISDVLVEPGEERRDVVDGLLAARSAGREPVDLRLQIRLRVRAVQVELLLEHAVRLGAAGEARQLAAPDVAEHVHQPKAILPGRVARAVLGADAGRAGDVRNSGRLVAHDGDVAASTGADRARHLSRRDAERRVIEVAAERAVREARVVVDEARVLAELVIGVRGLNAERLERQDLRERRVAVLAGRQNVVALALAVVVRGERTRGGVRRRRDANDARERRGGGGSESDDRLAESALHER